MRCAAKVGLLSLGLLGGCNQVFGISNTVAFDASVDVIADRHFVTLEWQLEMSNANGSPGEPQLLPIEPLPMIRIAKLGDATKQLDALVDPHQSASTYAMDGAIDIPSEMFTATNADGSRPAWRFEYTLADGVPHEVQWKPDDKVGRLTVPVFGRLARDPVPVGSGYSLSPMGMAPTGLASTKLFTTGLWSVSPAIPALSITPPIDAPASSMVSMSGALGKFDYDKGDRAILVGFNSSTLGVGDVPLSSTFKLADGMHSSDTSAWDNTVGDPSAPTPTLSDVGRFDVIKPLGSSPTGATMFGVSPSFRMPGLAASAAAAAATQLPLPMPVMIPTSTRKLYTMMTSAVMPPALSGFPKVLHSQIAYPRTLMTGAILNSGMESVMQTGNGGGFTLAFPAPFATRVTLISGSTEVPLDTGTTDQIPVAASPDPFVLKFVAEDDPDGMFRVDAYEVQLHTVTGDTLTTVRIYTIPASATPSVAIDGALLAKGTTYALEIRAIKGYPKASMGDFSVVDYPFGQTIVFPRTFVVQ